MSSEEKSNTLPRQTDTESPHINGLAGAWPAPKAKEPYHATKADGWFSVACFILGMLYIRWAGFQQGVGLALFTLLYAGTVLVYAIIKGVKPAKASWFWFSILLLTGISCGLWSGYSMMAWRLLLLYGSAVYWCASLFGGLLANKTSNYLPLDAINLLFVVPFKNFTLVFRSFKVFKREKTAEKQEKQNTKNRSFLYILLGVILCVPILAILLPILVAADSGVFGNMLSGLNQLLKQVFRVSYWVLLWQLVLGIPVAMYLCGLIAGNAHKRNITGFDLKKTDQNLAACRILPKSTILTVLGVVSALYILFIVCQIPYFFSAFMGQRPSGFEVYSHYARNGFFELCRIAGINLALLAAASALCAVPPKQSRLLRGFTMLLSVLTLVLIATAFSKMALYIGAYGLSAARVQTCVFMIFLALVYVALLFLQFHTFSLVRFAAVCGAVLLCGLCLLPLDSMVLSYNANRYIQGSLQEFDAYQLYGTGYFGIQAGMRVMENTEDKQIKQDIINQILGVKEDTRWKNGNSYETLDDYLVNRLDTSRLGQSTQPEGTLNA